MPQRRCSTRNAEWSRRSSTPHRNWRRKNAALEAASVARSRFLAAASHDLRQPLYALTLFSSALAVDEYDPQRLDRIAHIQECVQSLDHLFSELLDLSRLETGAIQVEISEFSLDQVFAEVDRNFDMVAEQRGPAADRRRRTRSVGAQRSHHAGPHAQQPGQQRACASPNSAARWWARDVTSTAACASKCGIPAAASRWSICRACSTSSTASMTG